MDRNKEVENLAEADRHIITAERALSRQTAIITRLEEDGHDSSEAIKELHEFEKTITVMRMHRENIIKMIAQIDAGLT